MTHQSTTKKPRTFRVDTRADYRKRTQERRMVQSKQKIQDIRVTSTQKSERKEREVSITPLRKANGLSSKDNSYLRSLRKKLKAIEILIKKQDEGEELNEDQLNKISQMDEIIEKIEKFQ